MATAIPLRALNNVKYAKNESALSAKTKLIDTRDHSTADDYSSLTDDEYTDDGFAAYSNRQAHRRRRNSRLANLFSPSCLTDSFTRCCTKIRNICKEEKEYHSRNIQIGQVIQADYPPNITRNQKYSVFTFLPCVLYEQFRFFLNFYFLMVALSQFIPDLKIGYLYTYWGPLTFVLFVTMCREAFDDFKRYRRDREINNQSYKKLTRRGTQPVMCSEIVVGDIIMIDKNQRVPADMVLLQTTEKGGACFIRTDQLDGETDWKLRLAVGTCQQLRSNRELFSINASIYAEKPRMDIYDFVGTFNESDNEIQEPLSIENTIWANTVVASGPIVGIVIYTGLETRSSMNASSPPTKIGLIDIEINQLTKVLFMATISLALLLVSLKGFQGPWYRYFFRFILLFSSIIPISLRVNLDMGKIVYSWMINSDKEIPGTVVRSSTIPEELGRVGYILSDKTGTLTQNEMVFKRLHTGNVSFGIESMEEMRNQPLEQAHEAILAIALCHNVTPVIAKSFDNVVDDDSISSDDVDIEVSLSADDNRIDYQASSPDEIALVKWTESVGITLVKRDLSTICLRLPNGQILRYSILQLFPFTSERKRMGIILKDHTSNEIFFLMKGADAVMSNIVQYNDWLEEECGNMAREGLRTLVVAKRILTQELYNDFDARYSQAKLSVNERAAKVSAVIERLEKDMKLLCLTGVEDTLQVDVRPTLELVRNAGIKVWMLTGDKMETAACIGVSARLISRNQAIHTFKQVNNRPEVRIELNTFRRKNDCALIIRGDTLDVCLRYFEHEFMEVACQCSAVICCRCSPTQKANIVRLIKKHTQQQTCAIGDGGNDVSMIQVADVGIGIVGKEGKQASLASDFSITQFKYIGRLLLWHGRNSYKRTASLSQFVIHRGLIISVMQAVFSSIFYFSSVALYQGFLMVGYATIYTMAPVFSLVLDVDVSAEIAMTYPELYKDLSKGRSLSYKTFFIWILISIYQGGTIMCGALLLFESEFAHIVSISFTALILTELLMVALTIRTWHWVVIVSEIFSLALYFCSMLLLRNYFDLNFITSFNFLWKVVVLTIISCVPLYILKFLRRRFAPPSYAKLT
ncbi:uncharacterized protein TRIADDRAFT_55823 [Trichoplax adhaerens]|uniref:Phospholipid-transporting ATPase n=1 Tax=Trichoplax adhaerens TaxID=10228 RepID=B3RVY7_TRIAD|nr:hypothetical protein TRIADDRAFT_55823 [Trichoplax adhaerens]EDV26080.1 hypothetical protein TRIADDRAFT_55823 [Trichoplax adhaerens]|eukprot:XP_002112113.1 hypothetical protein TRIADDRAFT_55823 [Trichoplax adhaerens]